jgi:hypothetical protein
MSDSGPKPTMMAIFGIAVQYPQTGHSGAELHFWHWNVGYAGRFQRVDATL